MQLVLDGSHVFDTETSTHYLDLAWQMLQMAQEILRLIIKYARFAMECELLNAWINVIPYDL